MRYQALYRRFRPRCFSEVVGQKSITATLQNQVKNNTVAHAYLFSGTRGTGKTSTAQIFARAIHCLAPDDGEACGHCKACVNSDTPDIVEIDAASNNGVDEIRDLREKVRFAPLDGQRKVYIIDEVHMLSGAAFNALLKTLEEPPAHAVFILATTEPQKLPATVLSRCQRFDFRRISLEDIIARLDEVLQASGAHFEPEALRSVALTAQGGLRDALSLADQCMAFCGTDVTNDQVLSMLGSMDASFLCDTIDALIRNDATDALLRLDRAIECGRDLGVFCRDLGSHARAVLLTKVSGDSAQSLLSCTGDAARRYASQAGQATVEKLLRTVSLLTQAEADMKRLDNPRVLLELALIRICRPQDVALMGEVCDSRDLLESLLERVAALEQRPIASAATNVQPTTQPKIDPPPSRVAAPADAHSTDAKPPLSDAPRTTTQSITAQSEKRDGESVQTEIVDVFPSNEVNPTREASPSGDAAQPSEPAAPTAEQVFSTLKERQTEAIRQIFHLYTWQTQLNGNTLEIEVPSACLPSLIATLRAKEDAIAASVHTSYPGLAVHFVDRLSPSPAIASISVAKTGSTAAKQDTPLAHSIKALFDENKVFFE